MVNWGLVARPERSKTRPKTPGVTPCPAALAQTTRARPVPSTATSGKGYAAEASFTANSAPTGAPVGSNRRPVIAAGAS